MDNLSDVYSCLRSLDSSKATDRKKNATRLQQLLDNDSVHLVLDTNSEQSRSGVITWDTILKGVNKYVELEISGLRTAKESQSATTLSNRDKKKHELADLFKFVIRMANNRGPKLRAGLMIDSIVGILGDEYTLDALGADYSSVLLKSVLRVRTYWLRLLPTQWRKLLSIYCRLYEEDAFDRDLIVRIIQELVTGSIEQGELNPRKLFNFFSQVMNGIRELRSPSVIENLLASLNNFCNNVGPACRAQLCGFGETHLQTLIGVWEKVNAEKIKEELIAFFHLFVRAHHPYGISSRSNGAFGLDWDLWQSQLLLLHELIVTDISVIAGGYKIISGLKEYGLKSGYVDFATDVFKQLPKTKVAPVAPSWSLTQFTQCTGAADISSTGTPAKKPRLAQDKKALLDLIRESSGTLQTVLWLQIVHSLLERYPEIFDDAGLMLCLELLVNVLGRCKRGQLYQHLFAGLSSLTRAIHQRGMHDKQLDGLMAELWSHCLSTINSRQAEVEGYQEKGFIAMASIIKCGYIRPRPEIWNLFLPGLCRPSPASDVLMRALLTQGLPENYVPSIVGTLNPGSSSPLQQPMYPLRGCLIKWLLPVLDAVSGFQESEELQNHSLLPERVAEVLYTLTIQDISAAIRRFKIQDGMTTTRSSSTLFSGQSGKHSSQPCSMESMHLSSLFAGEGVVHQRSSELSMSKEKCQTAGPHIPAAITHLIKHLNKVVRSVESMEQGHEALKYSSWLACMLANLAVLFKSNCSSDQDTDSNTSSNESRNAGSSGWSSTDGGVVDSMLAAMIEKCSSLFLFCVKQSSLTSDLLSPLLHLCAMLDVDCGQQDGRLLPVAQYRSSVMTSVAETIRKALPGNFVDLLIDIMTGKFAKPEANKRGQSATPKRQKSALPSDDADFDLFDMFDGVEPLNQTTRRTSQLDSDDDDNDMDLGVGGHGQANQIQKGEKDLLSVNLLTETQQIRLHCTCLLARLTSFDPRCDPETNHLAHSSFGGRRDGIDLDHIKAKLLHQLSIDCFNPAASLDIHMLLITMKLLLTNNHVVTDADIKWILRAVKQAAKEQLQDQNLCSRLVGGLRLLVPHLKGDENSQDDDLVGDGMGICRDFYFKIVSSFWQLASEGTPVLKLQMAELLLDIIKHDPNSSWGHLRIEQTNEDQDEDDAPGFSLSSVSQQFPRLLLESSLSVRAFVATNIRWLFVGGSETIMKKKTQRKLFDEIFMLGSELLNSEGESSSPRLHMKDELTNGQGIFLQVLLTIIQCSPVCEQHCLLGLFQMVSDKNISHDVVCKMLKQACRHLGYNSVRQYLSFHLPYLVHNWLHEEMVSSPLDEFPHRLLGYNTVKDFIRAHTNLIVAKLLATKLSLAEVKSNLTKAGLNVKDALLAALPDILVHILPPFAAKAMQNQRPEERASQQIGSKEFQAANRCFAALKQGLTEEEINENICERLGVIVVKVLSCLQVLDDNANSTLNMVYPDPNPPFYDEQRITWTLQYLAQNFNDGASSDEFSLVNVLAKTPNGLQQVFLSLSSLMCKEHQAHEQLRCLHMIRLFVNMVMAEIRQAGHQAKGSARSLAILMVRDILNRLLVLLADRSKQSETLKIPSYEEDGLLTCLSVLMDVCSTVLTSCPEELAPYLHNIVDAVANAASTSVSIGELAVKLLHTLTVVGQQDDTSLTLSCQQLDQARELLNPLPEVPVLDGVRTALYETCRGADRSLSQQLDDVLSLRNFACHDNTSQGISLRLKGLSEYISTHCNEMEELVKAEQGVKQLERFIHHLTHLCTRSSGAGHLEEAVSQCLGAIGPLKLHTLSLYNQDLNKTDWICDEFQGHLYEKYCWLFHALDASLLDESLEVVESTNKILQVVMATQSSRQFEKHFLKSGMKNSSLFRHLQPFKGCVEDIQSLASPGGSQPFSTVDKKELWIGNPASAQTHDSWIKTLVETLIKTTALEDEILQKIGPLCNLKVDICESGLPYIVHEILTTDSGGCRDILSKQFTTFFHTHCLQKKSAQQISVKYPIVMNKKSLRTMLRVLQFLRTQKRPQDRLQVPHTLWHNNLWLDFNYQEVAEAAQTCGACFSAVLFTEIAWGIHRQKAEAEESRRDNPRERGSSQDVYRTNVGLQEMGNYQHLLLEAYKTIGDPDGVYGCGAGQRADINSRVETYMHELQQEKALTTVDIALCNNSSLSSTLLLEVLQSCSTDYVLRQCLPKIESLYGNTKAPPSDVIPTPQPSDQLEEFRYQAAWRLGQWDLCPPHSDQSSSSPFHQSVYKYLTSLKDKHLDVARNCLKAARLGSIRSFDPEVETCSYLYPFLSQLQCLSFLDQVVDKLKTQDLSQETLASWMKNFVKDHNTSASPTPSDTTDFRFQQALLQLISATANTVVDHDVRPDVSGQFEMLDVQALWNLARCGRKTKHYQISERAIQTLKLKVNSTARRNVELSHERLLLEEAKLFWARSEVDIAKNVIHDLLQTFNKKRRSSQSQQTQEGDSVALHTQALVLYGNWLAETKSETPTVIISNFLQKAVDMIRSTSDNSIPDKTTLQGFASLASFADEQYQLVADYMRSPVYEEKKRLLIQSKSDVEECRELRLKNRITLMTIEKNFAIDEEEMHAMEQDRALYLYQALEAYLQCLKRGDLHNLQVFRVLALWFDNCTTPAINKLIEKFLSSIPSHKFLVLFYQLAARMGTPGEEDAGFQSTLLKLLERVACEHPHHALWVVLALAHAHKDNDTLPDSQGGRRGKKSSVDEAAVEERVHAAQALLQRVSASAKSSSSQQGLKGVVAAMTKFSLACIQLANMPVDKKGPPTQNVPSSLAIAKMQNLENIHIPIVDLPVDPSGSYTNLVSLVKFERSFKTAGGVNLPKIISCLGSDGVWRTTLVKGHDDLRQDAVMQQVFSLVNTLLVSDHDARQRQLNIRTYKVIPLSQNSGLLQWCEGTMPIGEYLAGRKNDAHHRYNPLDWRVMDCRKHLGESGSLPDRRLKAYQEICAHFHPVFRHFFLEHFVQPSQWFERRLAYTRSVATNSIVGYILGLGDRHVNNILIDLKTAELVHIDFGIAFERGRILPTPETVPFRLTRDIVDGMGITGVEGVFRRCCEKIMLVMKNNSEALLTIVQVLLHDPLSHWTLTPAEALALQKKRDQAAAADTADISLSGQVQASGAPPTQHNGNNADLTTPGNNESKESRNKVAERTLLRLKQKLSGQEDGAPLSVAGQVNLLIQKARDPHNLSRLFVGWQPYL